MNENVILTVVNVEYVSDYTLLIRFNNGDEKTFDFEPLLTKGLCGKLADLDYFKKFTIDAFTIDWNNEIGFAPEYLYHNGRASLAINH